MGSRSAVLDAYGDEFSWSLLDATADGVLIVAGDGEIVFVNDQALALFGYDAETLIGSQVECLIPEESVAIHRAHRTRYRAAPTRRAMGAGILLRARRADGTEFPVEISLSPLELGDEGFVVAVARDVTDRVAAEDHLHRVLHTLDASDDGVFIFDAETLKYSYVNEGATRLVGYDQDELLTMTPLHLNPRANEADYHGLAAALGADPDLTIVRQASLMRKDGVTVPVEKTYKSAPTDRSGERWIVTLARDISVRLTTEEELRRSQDALRQAEQIVAVAEDRDRIARDLHDTVIQRLFAAGLNLQSTMQITDATTRGRLEVTVDDLDETIKELRMAIFSLQATSAAPGGLRGKLLDVITDTSEALGFDPRLQFDGPIETIDPDIADHLVPVLREALTNVARHAGAQSARVIVSASNEVVLQVTDDGVGVPDEVLGGRGLANMSSRAQDLGGSCTVERLPGGGSTLTWRVPAGKVAPQAALLRFPRSWPATGTASAVRHARSIG